MTKEDVAMLLHIRKELQAEKGEIESSWKEIVAYMGQSYASWGNSTKPQQHKVSPRITDTTAADASATLADGVAGYAFNRSMAWFDFEIEKIDPPKEDDDVAVDKESVEKALQSIRPVAYEMFARSRFYIESRSFIRSCADLGTAIMYFYFDKKKNKPVFKTLHLKDVEMMVDHDGEVDTLFRDLFFTKREAKTFFGEDNLPKDIKECEDDQKVFPFIQFISLATRWDFDVQGKGDWLNVYLFDGEELPLKEERLKDKPFAVWRWSQQIFGGTWGVDSPGLMCLPIIKFVNLLQEDLITLSELVAKGHWKKTKGLAVNFKAGGVTELENGQDFGFMGHQGDLSWLSEHINYYRRVIEQNYKVELFLILSQNIDRTKTATEVAGLETEKSALMSSFFAQLGDEFLEPVIEWMFSQILVMAMPEDVDEDVLKMLTKLDVKIDFVSPMYRDQERNFKLMPTLQWLQDVLNLAGINPNVLDRVNFDKIVELDHSLRGADATTLIKIGDAKKAREIRAKAQAQMQQQGLNAQKLDEGLKAYDTLVNKAPKGAV